MARVTRSRKVDIKEDHTVIQTTLPRNRPDIPEALAEVNANKGDIAMPSVDDISIDATIRGLKAAYHDAIGGMGGGKNNKKAGKGKKRGKAQQLTDSEAPVARVVEDDENATSQPATEETRKILKSHEEMVPVSEQCLNKPPSPAVRTTRRQLAKLGIAEETVAKSKQEAIDMDKMDLDYNTDMTPTQTTNNATTLDASTSNRVASFAEKPVAKTLEEVERACETGNDETPAVDTGDDSFVEQIIYRSPAKPVSRIEDSVEALDKLEEFEEALDQAALPQQIISPEKTRRKGKQGNIMSQDSRANEPMRAAAKEQKLRASEFGSMRVKSTAPRVAVVKRSSSVSSRSIPISPMEDAMKVKEQKKAPVKRPTSLLPPKQPAKSTKPPTQPTFELPGEAVARRLKEQREARQAQRDGSEASFKHVHIVSVPKVKSTKAPTKPTFELPGEAISRRKREAYEARLKVQEEEERKKREFKAKPLRTNMQPSMVPRDTVASRARQSKIGIESIDNGNLTVATRLSTAGANIGAHSLSIQHLNVANISAPRCPGPTPPLSRKPSTTSGTSTSGLAMQRTLSASDVQAQRQRAKEIYNRDAKWTEEMERERRERGEAAKRAREEAAERGRQASREWAEKQRAYKMASVGKGQSGACSPGSQTRMKG